MLYEMLYKKIYKLYNNYHDEEIEMNLRLYENNSEILRYQHK